MFNIIKEIASKEFIEMIRDGRFRWAAIIVFSLLLTSLVMGWKHYREVEAEQDAAQAKTREQWINQGERNPHSAAHYGVYAFKPKAPLSFVDRGLDSYTGTAIWLEAHYQNPARYRPAEDGTAVQRFGELTAAAVLQLLVPLLIILLTFSAFTAEREQGTLQQLLSLGLNKQNFAIGKGLGISTALGVLLIPAAIIGVLTLSLTSHSGSFSASVPRMLLMAVGYTFYFGTFIGLSLFVSALSPTSRIALVLLLSFWIINSLLVPRLASDTAERLYHVPTSTEFWATVDKDKTEGIDGHRTSDSRLDDLKKRVMAEYGVQRLEDLPINFSGIALQSGEEYTNTIFDKHYENLWDIYEKQERVHKASAIFAPLLSIRSLSMGLAGTDLAHHRHFITAAEQYRRELNKMLNDDLAYSAKQQGFAYFANGELWEKTPDFNYKAPSFFWAVQKQVWSISLLFVWFITLIVSSIIAAGRIRIY